MNKYGIVASIALISCSTTPSKQSTPASTADSIPGNTIYQKATDTLILTHRLQQVADYPQIRDTAQWIHDMKQQWGVDVRAYPEQREGKFTAFKKIRINGSQQDLYLLEYYWGDGALSSYPWKCQFIISQDGRLIKQVMAERYALETVFPEQSPFLMITEVTARGNGGHSFYRMSADTLEDVYEGFGEEYRFKTVDRHQDNEVLRPEELPATYRDVDKDGYNDIVFSGKKIMLVAYTKYGDPYDGETVNGQYHDFSVDHPARIVPVEYVFLYDPRSQHFKWRRPSPKQMKEYLGH